MTTSIAANTLALPAFLNADTLAKAGIAVILIIVFAESGLLVGFFLPGDSVLFTFGMLIARGEISTPIWLACLLIGVAAAAGDQVGYLFGRKVGPALFRRPNSRVFKQEHIEKAHAFFEQHGARSIVLARFVPVIRTFTPIIAGVSRMSYRTFVMYNLIGAVIWGCGVTALGYFLGQIGVIRNNIEAILVLIVLISVVPIGYELLRARRAARRRSHDTVPAMDDTLDDEVLPVSHETTQVLVRPRPGLSVQPPVPRPTPRRPDGGGRHRR
ncbi:MULTISPECIES: DedA family protein [unclassified Pseudofrankia]|uniref:DedA family protein n=1 Tax=unclassified Pseudofrankia TaxID=2994372 RepID=UPI0009F2F429|nr:MULTISPECIES: VTT domain-containing protein [unclassified Pseudofrankia]MDT3444175.1 VTT domain-containing protein [Pseudofrankia sp. BMG5.37]